MKKRSRAFTLIELIAVLVIMAIIVLIVTPLVMTIIRKARVSADKRSIDAYGRSIELAIAGYLLDTGKFPTDISQLTIEYSGSQVVCETTQINPDSSVYLAGCTVGGRSVEGYAYGSEQTVPTPTYTAYQVGDHVSFNGVTYYVIEDSDTTNDTVKLLKEEPLTKTEMDDLNLTGITIEESNGYGKVQYGSSTDYSTSIVKQVVDAWNNTAVKAGDSATARLITYEEMKDNLGIGDVPWGCCGGCGMCIAYDLTEDTPSWFIFSGRYWSMSNYSSTLVWVVISSGIGTNGASTSYFVRPVLELNKSADIIKLD